MLCWVRAGAAALARAELGGGLQLASVASDATGAVAATAAPPQGLQTTRAFTTQRVCFGRSCARRWQTELGANWCLPFFCVMLMCPLLACLQDDVANALLSRLSISAILSLEPILALIAALARDLREEFVPFVPKVLAAYER